MTDMEPVFVNLMALPLSMLFFELMSPDNIYESMQMQTLTGYSNVLHALRPTKAPSFTYSWLELMADRMARGVMSRSVFGTFTVDC